METSFSFRLEKRPRNEMIVEPKNVYLRIIASETIGTPEELETVGKVA